MFEHNTIDHHKPLSDNNNFMSAPLSYPDNDKFANSSRVEHDNAALSTWQTSAINGINITMLDASKCPHLVIYSSCHITQADELHCIVRANEV